MGCCEDSNFLQGLLGKNDLTTSFEFFICDFNILMIFSYVVDMLLCYYGRCDCLVYGVRFLSFHSNV